VAAMLRSDAAKPHTAVARDPDAPPVMAATKPRRRGSAFMRALFGRS
jgi:hypothetical protein